MGQYALSYIITPHSLVLLGLNIRESFTIYCLYTVYIEEETVLNSIGLKEENHRKSFKKDRGKKQEEKEFFGRLSVRCQRKQD